MNKEELIKYIFNEENYSNFISSQNGGEQYYILLEKEESKILKDYISNLQKKVDKQKEVLDKIKEYCKNKIDEQKSLPDYRQSYLENYDNVINTQHLSHSGVMLETVKSTTIKRYEDILELLEEIE